MNRYTYLPGQVDRYESPDDQRRRAEWTARLSQMQGMRSLANGQPIAQSGTLGNREQAWLDQIMASGAQPGQDTSALLTLLGGVADLRAQPSSRQRDGTSPVGNFPPPQRPIVRGGG